MKLIHLSDLHIGKRFCGISMLEDQQYILNEILDLIQQEKPDGVLIAGDIYDKSVPSAEAVRLFDTFLTRLSKLQKPVFLISGNHDSAERIAFGARLLCQSGIYLSTAFSDGIVSVPLQDAYGPVMVYLLPFLKPAHVRALYPEAEINSYSDAMQVVIDNLHLDPTIRNVAVAHQFVRGSTRCESEDLSIGGLDELSAEVFAPFDYTALGHLHSPQTIGNGTIRYCGTPLKYSFSELHHKKSITVVELREKGVCELRTVPLTPRREVRELRGTFAELTDLTFYQTQDRDCYYRIVLTDEESIIDAAMSLRQIFPNLASLTYDNTRTRAHATITGTEPEEEQQPLALFEAFYLQQNGSEMSEKQRAFSRGLMTEIWG